MDKLSYAQLVNQDDFTPEDHGLPSLPLEDHELTVVFDPTSHKQAVSLAVKTWRKVHFPSVDPESLKPYFAWRPTQYIKKTLECTTQLAKSHVRYPMRRHFKARNPFSNVHRLAETVYTDPIYANCYSINDRFSRCQIFFGGTSFHLDPFGLRKNRDFFHVYQDFIRYQGAPSTLRRDNALEESSEDVINLNRKLFIKDAFSEPHHQHQNLVEGSVISWIKRATHTLMDRVAAPDSLWFLAIQYLCDVWNYTWHPVINMTPHQFRHGVMPDISAILQFTFYQKVFYLDHEETFPSSKERAGRWVGLAKNIGDALTCWILDEQSKRLLARSVVRPADKNKKVKWDPMLDIKQVAYGTAHHGGDIYPSNIDDSRLSDEFDDAEPSPKPHPPCVTSSVSTPSPNLALKSIIKDSKSQEYTPSTTILATSLKEKSFPDIEGFNLDGKSFMNEVKSPDEYEGPSLLRFGNEELLIHPDIPVFPTTKKLPQSQIKYNSLLEPVGEVGENVDDQNFEKVEYENVSMHFPDANPKVPSEKSSVVEDNDTLHIPGTLPTIPTSRKSRRVEGQEPERGPLIFHTRWIPSSPLKWLGGLLLAGLMFLPTHVSAEPTHGLVEMHHPSQWYSNMKPSTPLSHTPDLDKLRAYHAACDRFNMLMDPQPEDLRWNISHIKQCSYKEVADNKKSIFFKAQYGDGAKAWMPMDIIRLEDPYLVIDYAMKHNLDEKEGFDWIKPYLESDQEHLEVIRSFKTSQVASKTYKFGVEVPKNPSDALRIDRETGTTGWRDSIKAELDQIHAYDVFKVVPDGVPMPQGYKRIPYHIIHDVKFDGRLKSRLVAGGHCSPEVDKEDRFSTVVSMEAVRIGFMMAKLNGLQVCAGDIGNAFLNAQTNEKLYIIAGPEFGPEYAGKRLIIDKALYGLKTSSARFHELTTTHFAKLGFKPCKADPDLLIKHHPDGHYEYIARFVDDVIAFAKDPLAIMKILEQTYVMKGVGAPRYYLGGDVMELDEQWQKENLYHSFSAQTYIQNLLPKVANLLQLKEFTKRKTPMDSEYHPELDESPFVAPDRISKYRSMIGSLNWIVILGRFDIAYALNTMSRYSMAPREGHFKAMERIFGYLRQYPDGQLIIDSGEPPIRKQATVSTGYKWSEFYPDVSEDIPRDMPIPKGNLATLTCYVDADHARDQVTRKSVTGIVLLMNNTPLTWISKRQKTVETSTYGSELVAARIAVDLLVEWRYKLRMLGLNLEKQSWLLGDNMSVVLNTTLPSSSLKKKHQACNYHRVREAIAGGYLIFGHIDSEENVADICTKPLPTNLFSKIGEKYLFRKPTTLLQATN